MDTTLALIIDGNNLAHHLYQIQNGTPLTTTDTRRMTADLGSYARTHKDEVEVELCLDHLSPGRQLPVLPGVRVFIAAPPEEADDLLLQRFRFHHHQNRTCIVLTNDTQVRDTIHEEGGACLLVYDFVRRPAPAPVFRQPVEFHAFTRRGTKRRPVEDEFLPRIRPARTVRETHHVNKSPLPSLPPTPPPDIIETPPPLEEPTPQPVAEPAYRLTIESWPVEAGLRFLVDSFCLEHGREYREIYRALKPGEARYADLVELTGALLATCAREPDFARQGSLLDQVRLALLRADGHTLTLSELIAQTGLNPRGLQGRIREKAGPWIEIILPVTC